MPNAVSNSFRCSNNRAATTLTPQTTRGVETAEVARAVYLVDTSAFARLSKPNVASAIGPLSVEGKIALCAPVAFELGFSARSVADYWAIMSRIDAFESAPTTEGDHQRAIEVQRLLAQKGSTEPSHSSTHSWRPSQKAETSLSCTTTPTTNSSRRSQDNDTSGLCNQAQPTEI